MTSNKKQQNNAKCKTKRKNKVAQREMEQYND